MILYLDTNGANQSIKIFSDSELKYEISWPVVNTKRRDILVEIEKFLADHQLKLSDLTGIVVYIGPGSFTSVRVGVTIANTLGLSLDIPVIGIKGLDYNKSLPVTEISKRIEAEFKADGQPQFSEPVQAYYETSL